MFAAKSLFLWTLLVIWSSSASALTCPVNCQCDGAITVTCANLNKAEFDQLFVDLGSDPIGRLTIRECATPLGRVDGFARGFRVRSLEISTCGVSGFGADVFRSLANDLVELRLAGNNLTAMPFLQNLHNLELLSLNKNSVC
jgi:hypothetical protein